MGKVSIEVILEIAIIEPTGVNWDSGGLIEHICGNFDLVFQCHFGVIQCTCPKMTCNLKRLPVEGKRLKLGTRRICRTYMG